MHMGQVMVNDAWRILSGAGVVRGSWSPTAGLPGLESCCPCAIWAHTWTKCCLKGRGGVCPMWPWWNSWYHCVPTLDMEWPYDTVGHACTYKVDIASHFTNPLWALKQGNTLSFTHAHQWHHPTLSSSLPPPYQFTTTPNQFAATPTSLTKGCDKSGSRLDFNCLTLLPPLTGKRNKGSKERQAVTWHVTLQPVTLQPLNGAVQATSQPMDWAVQARHVTSEQGSMSQTCYTAANEQGSMSQTCWLQPMNSAHSQPLGVFLHGKGHPCPCLSSF